MTNKERFLRDNVGFHFEDLSLIRQTELEAITNELQLNKEWVLLALSKNKLEEWEKWGFALFKKTDFRKEVDQLLRTIDNISEEKFKKENNRKNPKNPTLNVDEKIFRKMWDGVKKQGSLYTEEEAAARNLTCYWTYGNIVQPEQYSSVNLMVAQENLPEEDWALFCISVKEIKIIG